MFRRFAGGLLAMVLVLVLGLSKVSAQTNPAPPPAPPRDLPPVASTPPAATMPPAASAPPSPPWVFPAEPAMLEYVLGPGTESCRDEEHFRLELAIVRDARRDKEFLPFDLYDDERVLVRITLSTTPAGKFQGVVEHVPPAGQVAAPEVVKVNSECKDLVRDLAFAAAAYLPFLERPKCTQLADAPCPAPVPSPVAPASATAAAPPVQVEPRAQGAACDPDKDGDEANDEACERLLARLRTKYGRPVEFWLLGGGLMTLVYTSDPGAGVVIGGAVQGKRWSVGLEAQVTLPAPVRVAPSRDADISSFVGLVVPCVRLGETVRFVGCGVVGGGAILSYDAENPVQSLSDWTVRLGPRAGVEVPLGDRFAFFASGEVSFAPVLQVLNYRPPLTSWVQSPASVFLSVGFSVRLGDRAER